MVAVIGVDKKDTEQPESAPETKSGWSYLRRFLDWFCGLDSTTSAATTPKTLKRPRDMTSLHQTTRARAALYTALTVLITLDLFLYVFFSSGSDFGLLRNGSPSAFEFPDGNASTATSLPGNRLTITGPLNHTLDWL